MSVLGSVVVDVRVGEVKIRALVDAGFYGDMITSPEVAERVGAALRFERFRVLPDGKRVKVRYGIGEMEVLGEVTGGDIEVLDRLELPQGVEALIGVTALEKLGFRVNPRTGKLEKMDLYLL